MSEKIDVQQVFDVMEQIVAEHPNFVYMDNYEQCRYTDFDGEPACIVGHVLDRLGLARPPFNPDGSGSQDPNTDIWSDNGTRIAPYTEPFTLRANMALQYAQAEQDGRVMAHAYKNGSWDDALAYAKEQINGE